MKRNKKKKSLIDEYKELSNYAFIPLSWACDIQFSGTNPILKVLSLWLGLIAMLVTMILVGLWLIPIFTIVIIPLFIIGYLFGIVGVIIDIVIGISILLYEMNRYWEEREKQIYNYLGRN